MLLALAVAVVGIATIGQEIDKLLQQTKIGEIMAEYNRGLAALQWNWVDAVPLLRFLIFSCKKD